jgi:hypothetical protein
MASDLLFCSGARTRTWDLRVMSFAPGAGASELISMLPRVPMLLRCSRARMSSMARSRNTIEHVQADVNREITMRLKRHVLAACPPHPSHKACAVIRSDGGRRIRVVAENPIRTCRRWKN